MLRSLKKNAGDAQDGSAGKTAPLPPKSGPDYSDFIPYYAHLNAHTLLTKNGEVMQTIKIAADANGIEYEGSDASGLALRDMLRDSIVAHTNSLNFSFWIHTLRKRKQVDYHARFQEDFATYSSEQWGKKQKWKHQFYNEVYVTVLHDGQSSELFDKTSLKHVVLPTRNRKYRNAYLDQAVNELDQLTGNIISALSSRYQAQRLSAVERLPVELDPAATRPIFYSEPMEFLGHVLNLRQEPHPLPDTDLSVALHTNDLTFGYNAMESKNVAGKKRFGALLTVKQHCEIPAEMLDVALQAPVEMIVSQAFHLINEDQALWEYRTQNDLFRVSGDEYSIRASGIEQMLQGTGKAFAYGTQQTTIMVAADEFRTLNSEVVEVQSAFGKLGMITIREDIKLEECFWSTLPGNFIFLRRKSPILTEQIAGMCRLNRFPNGSAVGNHWGNAVALMPTIVNSPFYFNFHHHDNGHTVMFDFNSFNDHTLDTLLHFLLSQTRQFAGKLFVFDRNQSAELFFDKLGANYHHFERHVDFPKRKVCALNPLWLEDTPRNRGFLLAWCSSLIEHQITVTDTHKEILRDCIGQILNVPSELRNLAALAQVISSLDAELGAAFAPWIQGGAHSEVFGSGTEMLDASKLMHAFDMTSVVKHPDMVIPVFSYLIHRIISTVDGRPTIIVLRDAWDLLENAFFAPRLESLLEMLKQNNVMVILTSKHPHDCVGSHIFGTIMQACATHIYIPDDVAVEYESKSLDLTAQDKRMLLKMERQKGDFLLKQHGETVGLRVDMSGMDDLQAIFANNIKNLVAAGGPYAVLPEK